MSEIDPIAQSTGLIPSNIELIQILKAKLDKEKQTLEVHMNLMYPKNDTMGEEPKDVFAETIVKFNYPIHHDLAVIFKELSLHLAFVSDQLDSDDFSTQTFNHYLEGGELKAESEKVIKKIICTQIHINPDEDKGTVSLGGQRLLKSDYVLNMFLTNIRLNRTENYNYAFHERLKVCVESFLTEVTHYLYGKRSGPEQLQLPFGDGLKAKRGRKAKEVIED